MASVLQVLFLPYLATGHLIPLVNAARLFASCGDIHVTILTTPSNALFFRSSIDDNDTNISVHTVTFPSTEVGLPEGLENLSSANSPEIAGKVIYAIHFLLQKPMEEKIREINPDAIFSDKFFPWTVDIAEELNIPRIVFNQSSYMYNTILHNLKLYKPEPSHGFLVVPGLPDTNYKLEFKLSQIPDYDLSDDKTTFFERLLEQTRASEDRSFGIVHDTFYELEPVYADYYQKLKKQTKCWHIGPISHFSYKKRGSELVNNVNGGIIEWLNAQKPQSVLYISFGSMVKFQEEQLNEIAKALEDSSVPFLWVLQKDDQEKTLPVGFEERTTGKTKTGLVIRGWAPQLTILDHSAIGGFMTHCGWNSVLEGITSGVPLLTWPVFAEQFYNEKLVEVLGLGVKVGSEKWSHAHQVMPLLGYEKIKEGIGRLMGASELSQRVREKAVVTGEMAKNAIEEGGSSWNSLTALIDDLKNFASK